MDRDIADLDARFQPFVAAFQAACGHAGIPLLIYCTKRTFSEQAALYNEGRSDPGPIRTNAPPGQSAHNYGLAFDGCPMVNGKPAFDLPLSHTLWQQYGSIARSVGCEWGGDWKGRMVEGPHVQMANWRKYILPAHTMTPSPNIEPGASTP